MRHMVMFNSAGVGPAAAWNRELVDGLNGTLQEHLGAMNRKHALRAQQMTFCVTSQGPYVRPSPGVRRPPC